jgi:hypothetical protein
MACGSGGCSTEPANCSRCVKTYPGKGAVLEAFEQVRKAAGAIVHREPIAPMYWNENLNMKTLLIIALLTLPLFAQNEDGPKPDRWRGLVIDESTPDDAIKGLGTPKEDKVDRIRIFDVDSKWISKKQSERIFRKLKFEKPEGFDTAELSFLDNKLVFIDLDFAKEIEAASLSRIYGIQFAPQISGLQEGMFPKDYERNEGRVYPKSYPAVYKLVGVTEKVFIGSLVSNSGLGAIMRAGVGARDTGDFPGKSARLQIVSRRLENRDGADVLK